jgi:hypothetical protein
VRFERTLPRGATAPVAAMGNLVFLLVFLFAALPFLPAVGGEGDAALRVRVDGRGELAVDGRPVAARDLAAIVAEKVRNDPSVRVEADLAAGLPVARIREILELLRPAAVIDIVFTPVAGREPEGRPRNPATAGS